MITTTTCNFFTLLRKQFTTFLTEKGKVSEAIQVTYELNESNTEREMKGMLSAMKAFNLKKGLILTYDLEKEIKVDGKKIIVKPIWKWLLGV